MDNNNVQQGDTVVYTLTVSNAGPSDATNVVITDNLPSGQSLVSSSGCAEDPAGVPTCTIGTVAAGASATATLTVQVTDATGIQTNTATVNSDSSDPVAANNEASVRIAVTFSIPTLGSWGLALMALLLAALGVGAVRRGNA